MGIDHNTNSAMEGDLEESFVGKNYDFYIGKWDKIEDKKKKTSWNWAAFFLGPFWFGYRKMYIPVLFFAAAYLIIDLFLFLLHYQYTEESYFFSPVDRALGLPVSIILGLLGNYIYLKHTNKYIDKSNLLQMNAEQKMLWLKKKGGTSWLGVLLTFFIFIGYGILSSLLFPTNVDKILFVKDGSFYEYPTTTIGDQFDYFFDELEWEYLSSDSPYDIVRFTGVGERDGYDVNLAIDFILTDDSFEIYSAKMNNEEMSEEEINSLIEVIFAEEDIEPIL
ncbi:DUF2628 domain-containing protein [Neobacillus drentensis]|uniref:DUF2628 domain-containing protein n=1 Tax=Neobacillus drentensis TaxID=220684 RepID=UPI002FFD8CB7